MTTFFLSLIVFDGGALSTKLLFGAMVCLGLSLVSTLPVFPPPRKSILMKVGLNGIRTPDTFIGFERLVTVQVSLAQPPADASLVLLTNNGDKLTFSVAGGAEAAATLIEERREVHAELTKTRKVTADGYRNVRVQEGIDGDLSDAMRDAGVEPDEMAECLALADSVDAGE